MNLNHALKEIERDPLYCRYCKQVTHFAFQVAENTSRGQLLRNLCGQCQQEKGRRFIPYRSVEAYERIYEKDYRDKKFRGLTQTPLNLK